MEQGREMDRRLLSFHFDDGPQAAVLEELANYQNEDGGFGRGLEPDVQMPGSSVMTTTMALRILREVKAPSSDEIVRKALEYLTAQYDSSRRVWPIVPQEVDEFPHAPWWNFENTAETFGHFLANPRAEVVGYLHQYQELAPARSGQGAHGSGCGAHNRVARRDEHVRFHLLCSSGRDA